MTLRRNEHLERWGKLREDKGRMPRNEHVPGRRAESAVSHAAERSRRTR